MRRIGELMKELGFNEKAPESTTAAFIRHLVSKAESKPPEKLNPPEQLSFDLGDEQHTTPRRRA